MSFFMRESFLESAKPITLALLVEDGPVEGGQAAR
jgi:hypothetical protein